MGASVDAPDPRIPKILVLFGVDKSRWLIYDQGYHGFSIARR
jgi:hypothetical protein